MRVPYWNINHGVMIDVLAVPALIVFVFGLYRYWKLINQGKMKIRILDLNPFEIKKTINMESLFLKGILGLRIYKKIFTGIAHGGLFWGMAFLFLGTVLVFLNVLLGLPIFNGGFNKYVMAFGLDLAGLAVLLGIIFMLLRRLFPSERMSVLKSRNNFISTEILLFLIICSGFLIEALRIANSGVEASAFVGNIFALSFGSMNGEAQLFIHQYTWWLHGFLALIFIAYIPYSPLAHMILAPVNTALSDSLPGIRLDNIDFSKFDDEESDEMPVLGADRLIDFSSRRLLDFSTCLWCGRCHEVCPAAQTDKPLSPKGVMIKLAERLNSRKMYEASIVDEISVDAVFSCTTCAACAEACPVGINQPKAILELRRNLVMERSELPELMGKANKSLESRQHPFFGTASGSKDWSKDIDPPVFEKGKTEYLLWLGCAITYEERAQYIAKAMVRILRKADVSFGILENTRCTGDPAKQMGNEFLFNEIALANIEEFSSLGVTKIITMCPHCYNSLTAYYPGLGGNFKIIPHVVMINKLLESKKLCIIKTQKNLSYHDPCYLGRHNHIYKDPRELVSTLGRFVEMPMNRDNSFCCGGGGGNYWAEETGIRINLVRSAEAFGTGADKIATACPFCLLMITDGMKKYTDEKKIYDIAELVDLQML